MQGSSSRLTGAFYELEIHTLFIIKTLLHAINISMLATDTPKICGRGGNGIFVARSLDGFETKDILPSGLGVMTEMLNGHNASHCRVTFLVSAKITKEQVKNMNWS